MSTIRNRRPPATAIAAICLALGAAPCLAQGPHDGQPITPDSAEAIRRSLQRPPPKPPADLVDAIALPFRLVVLPVRAVGHGVAELVGLAARRDPEPPPIIEILRQAGFRGRVGGIGPRSGAAAIVDFRLLSPVFLESAFSVRGSQRHRAGLAFGKSDDDQLALAYTFWRNNEPHFYGGIGSAENARRVYLWDQQSVSLIGNTRRPVRRAAALVLATHLGYEDNRVGRGQDRGTTSIQADTLTAGLYGVAERVKYLHVGGTVGLDLRYNAGLQSRGLYVEGSYDYFAGVDDTDSDFSRVDVELFGYLPINPRQQLALRLLAEVNRDLSGRGVPFYHLAYLGSERGGRAYHQRRFQDLAMAALMLEWRWEVWRELHERSRVESFLFYDVGSVMPQLADLRIRDLRGSIGFGWRLIDRHGGLLTNYIAFGDDGVRLRVRFSSAF